MNWRACKLGDLLTLKRGHDLPERIRVEGSIPVVSSAGITGYHNVSKAKPPGVVTGRYGTLGQVYYLDREYWPLNTALYVVDFKETIPKFAAYLLKHVLKSYQSDKAAVPGVDRNVLHELKTLAPDTNTQQRIVRILSTYDDLIVNHKRRIQLLEQAAQLLYKEWFVHLRFPGHEHVKIVDGVPEGWSVGVVSDYYFTGSGGTPSRKNPDYFKGEIPWVKTRELKGRFIYATEEQITDQAVQDSSAKLFPRHTVLVAMYGATIGQTAILSIPAATNQACCAIIPKDSTTSYVHAYLFFVTHAADLVGLGQGSAQNNISQQVISSFKMVLPEKYILEAFTESVSPIMEQIEMLGMINARLIRARDLLLPRLMSGELRV